jgi:hypothetical protein
MANIFFITFAALVFPIFWGGTLLLLSHIGGWARLAKHYRSYGRERGQMFYLRSARVGWVGYGSCLTFGVNDGGLQMSVLWPFRIGHPPLFIPWGEFHNIYEKRHFLFHMFDSLDADIGNPTVARVRLPNWMSEYVPQLRSDGRLLST